MSNGCSVPVILCRLVPDLATLCELCRPECDAHDQAYYEGADGDFISFCAANERFYAGILPKIGEHWATLWYGAVQIHGWRHWGTGCAWDGRRLWKRVEEEQQSP